MTRLNLCILYSQVPQEELAAIRALAPQADVACPSREEQDEALADAEIVFGSPSQEQLERARNVRWIHIPTAGADRFVRSDLVRERGITITNSSGCFGIPIAEHVLALMLGLTRKLGVTVRNQARSEWVRPGPLGELFGKTVGILGLGDIGTEVARRAHAFGMQVVAMRRRRGTSPPFVVALYGPEETDKVVQAADFLVLCLPGTEATRGILSRQRIESMKPGSYVINIGRGSLIDEPALVDALRSGRLAGAGLDVFSQEPLPTESPLWKMENVLITPHTSGNSPMHPRRTAAIFLRNLERYLKGEPLENVVDLEWGYSFRSIS